MLAMPAVRHMPSRWMQFAVIGRGTSHCIAWPRCTVRVPVKLVLTVTLEGRGARPFATRPDTVHACSSQLAGCSRAGHAPTLLLAGFLSAGLQCGRRLCVQVRSKFMI